MNVIRVARLLRAHVLLQSAQHALLITNTHEIDNYHAATKKKSRWQVTTDFLACMLDAKNINISTIPWPQIKAYRVINNPLVLVNETL